MSWTQSKIKQVKSRLLAGKIMELLGKEDMLYKNIGTRIAVLDEVKTRLIEIEALNLEEQEALEEAILEQIRLLS